MLLAAPAGLSMTALRKPMDARVPSQEPDTRFSRKIAQRKPVWPWLLLAMVAVAAVLVWREPWKQRSPTGGLSPGGPASAAVQSVAVATVAKGDMPITLVSLGTVTPLATVTVKSQISGYLTEIHFHEGQMVKKGDLLVQIDPRPYEAALGQYEGQLEKDQALLDNARLDLERYRRLNKQDSISKQTVDTAEATVRQYEGTVHADQAQVDTQKLNLIYCRIISPVEGRVGLRQVDVGNYVTASDTNGVVVVTQLEPISAVFTLPEDSLRPLMKRLRAGAHLNATAYDRTNVEKLADGVLDTVDNQIDTTTGTVKLRALFPNADDILFPNQFVNIRLLLDTLRDAILVPASAVQTGTPGTFVYLVNPNNTVSVRKIQTGASADGRVAVLSGLAVGDSVVVDGIDHLSDGAAITIPAAANKEKSASSPQEPGAGVGQP
jgi:multidrug efflux system membrane fusion protein